MYVSQDESERQGISVPMREAATVDILMATYNGSAYLEEQISSIQAQSFPQWRLLVADDGSTDGTCELLQRLGKADGRIQVLEDGVTHRGPCARFLWLLGRSQADYVMFCDQDDVWDAQKVDVLLDSVRELEQRLGSATPALAFSDAAVVDDGLAVVAPSFMEYENFDPYATSFRQLMVCNNAPGCTMLFNRAAADAVRVPQDLSQINMHDWWLMLVVSALGEVVFVDRPLVRYRQHGANTFGAQSYDVGRYLVQAREVACAHIRNQRQAGAFFELYGPQMSHEDWRAAHDYAQMRPYGVQPVATIIRHGLWQPGIERRIGQVLLRLFCRVSS